MTPEIAAHIFEPFFTTKALGKGTGLGLSMVFGFIKQSGGHINVYSEPGAGTTFRLYLPRATEAKTVEREMTVLPLARGAGEKILVVEDNAPLRRIVQLQLADLGYRTVPAANAAEALELLESEPIDLVFTDIVMPGEMNGFALARHVAANWPKVKIVLTSGFPDSRMDGNGAAAPVARLLSKPYRKADLARVLREAFGS
jgi:CheY-like chemotaxis protein